MKLKKICYSVNSLNEAKKAILLSKKNNIYPILYIKYFLIDRFGLDWLSELIKEINNQYKEKNFKIYVECKKNYGLFISLTQLNIDYIKVVGNKETLKRLKEIAKVNKVLINPNFSIVVTSKKVHI